MGAGDESTYPDLLQKGRGQYAKIFPDAGLLNIKGTNAEGMTYKGIEVDKVLVPVHFVNNDQIIKNNHMFYVLDGRIEQFRKIDKNDKQGLAVTKGIVNAIKSINSGSSLLQRAKDYVGDFFDPDQVNRSGYDVLQRPNADRSALGVGAQRAVGGIEKGVGAIARGIGKVFGKK